MAPSTGATDTEASRVRPVETPGEVTLDWNRTHRLGAWFADLQIFEGTAADTAELAIAAGEDGLHFSFSAQFATITPAEMAGLAREYLLAPDNHDNLLLLEVKDEAPLVASGWLLVDEIDAGVISGTFSVTIEDPNARQAVEGQFHGPLRISCNVLATPDSSADSAGSATNPSSATWTSVAADHPFCSQYL